MPESGLGQRLSCADYYEAGTAELIPSQPVSQFLRLHAAGKIQAIRLEFSFTDYAQLAIGNIAFNAPVPFHFSMIRTAAMLTLLCLIALFRNPAAYRLKASGRQAMAAGISVPAAGFLFHILSGDDHP